jgi:hypothetical protein
VIDPAAIARQFAFPGEVLTVREYGSGNVNDTYLARIADTEAVRDFILQRLNPHVFPQPERIMHNLRVLDDHVRPKLPARPNRRWELPAIIPTRTGADYYRDQDGGVWRAQTFIAGTESFDAITDVSPAEEAGRGLGFFHGHPRLPHLLHDTCGFVTPVIWPKTLAAAPTLPTRHRKRVCPRCIAERKGGRGARSRAPPG